MKLQRLIAILTALLQKDCISASWFSDKFGVSVRTIYRDIEALESAGIPIVTQTGVNGGFSIMEGYKIDKKLFTHQDIATLLTSLYSVSGSSISTAQMNQTLEKIKSLIPEEYHRSIELTSKQLYIDISPWLSNPVITETLKVVQKSLADNHVIRFDYLGRRESSANRTVEPHQLVLKENNWYLKAWCREKQEFRTFKLSRIRNLQITGESFEPREFVSGMSDFKDWQSERSILIDIVITEALRERALDYCREETMTELDSGKIAIHFPFIESDMGYGVLLSMGAECEVIRPVHVREELIRRIEQMRKTYP
ncbi:helix-turn-helix transcriptional regulator [Ohessyouella blattaphilus]|uniref:YafY family transcriptional regulator n=1 Tax=Ohessyouella blattaphilus TaxID=2949333 RepID=A0ABT1EG97_9FIRM|nr:YafY family protein [Ohessyouella blattaphilus]MCP1109678.1 YafY family transcriptional regulator [Ohessyouella blattaphilus]MCR8563072.1 YafY family transcriptional regulator [Ohessyouella blattaphilus]